jgi:hypothetical protein
LNKYDALPDRDIARAVLPNKGGSNEIARRR